MSELQRKPRLYWSQAQYERDINLARHGFPARSTCLGRLEDGSEVEYNILLSDDSAPEPSGDHRFLGRGEYVSPCRRIVDDRPLEQFEMDLLKSPYLPDTTRNSLDAVGRLARILRDGQLGRDNEERSGS